MARSNSGLSTGARIAMALVTLMVAAGLGALVVFLIGSYGGRGEQVLEKAVEQNESAQDADEAGALVFETTDATFTFRGLKDVDGKAMLNFELDNHTEHAVLLVPENVTVNDAYPVEAPTGSTTPVGPGKRGLVPLTFDVPSQDDLSGTSDIKTVYADLVLVDETTHDRIAVVPVSVTI